MSIENMTKEQLEKELEECKAAWSRFSCDCLGYYMNCIEKKLKQLSCQN